MDLPKPVKSNLLLLLVIAGILYGSLYPFALHFYDLGHDGLTHLLGTWRDMPQSRGDLIANILLYMPLGFAAGSASRTSVWPALLKTVGIGAGLSFLVEWLQYYDQTRVSSLSDFYVNVFGSLAGVLLSRMRAFRLPMVALPEGGSAIFARVLLFAWLAWRLYPYAPVIDLHKYWNSVKPAVLHPEIQAYDLFRFAVLWMGVSFLLRIGLRRKMAPYQLLSAMAFYFCAKILIVDQTVELSEAAGAAFALILFCLPQMRGHPAALALPFAVIVVLARLLPWQPAETLRSFQWIPFYSLFHGSLTNNILAFCEKIFLYGTLLLLLVEAGLSLLFASLGECLMLLATSGLQTLIAGRSAEVTDAIIALLLALAFLQLDRDRSADNLTKGPSAKIAGISSD